jgi:hypothetical protein
MENLADDLVTEGKLDGDLPFSEVSIRMFRIPLGKNSANLV